jgi:hypothetical protein
MGRRVAKACEDNCSERRRRTTCERRRGRSGLLGERPACPVRHAMTTGDPIRTVQRRRLSSHPAAPEQLPQSTRAFYPPSPASVVRREGTTRPPAESRSGFAAEREGIAAIQPGASGRRRPEQQAWRQPHSARIPVTTATTADVELTHHACAKTNEDAQTEETHAETKGPRQVERIGGRRAIRHG